MGLRLVPNQRHRPAIAVVPALWSADGESEMTKVKHAPPVPVLVWAEECYENTMQLAEDACGEDRAGWLEDAAYWRQVLHALRAVQGIRAAAR